MNANMSSRMLLHLSIIVAFLSALSMAWTLPFGLGTPPPPAALLTTEISPQCIEKNNGTYLCCAAAVDGGNVLVQLAADAAHYELPANTLNGYLCEKSTDSCTGASVPVCCQVITLFPVWGLWCQPG